MMNRAGGWALHALWAGCLFVGGVVSAAAEVTVYPTPKNLPAAADFRVEVDGQAIFVHDTEVAAFATFSMDGPVEVTVTPEVTVQTAVVRPFSYGIEPVQQGRNLKFRIEKPGQMSLELNGDIRRPLYLFANPPEEPAPKRRPEVHYFEAGKIHEVGELTLQSGETLYLPGGAVLRGTVRAKEAKDIAIRGYGIIDARNREEKTRMIRFDDCDGILVQGITTLDSFGWTLHLKSSQNVVVDRMKQIGWRANSDGIDIDGSSRVKVMRSFLRNADDCVAVKAIGTPVEKVEVTETVFWNSLPGNAVEIGFELKAPYVRDVVFRDCDIIRVERGAVFSIHNGDQALVEDVHYENIRVEGAMDELFDFTINRSIYSTDCPTPYRRSRPDRERVPEELRVQADTDNRYQWVGPRPGEEAEVAKHRGRIRNVSFRNIEVRTEKPLRSFFEGYDAEHGIDDVRFEGIRINGRPVTNAESGGFRMKHARGVRFLD